MTLGHRAILQACEWALQELGHNANISIPDSLLLAAPLLRREYPPRSRPDECELLECPADGTAE
jgi:hypothetical protein